MNRATLLFAFLQVADIVLTFVGGGVESEANPVAAWIWTSLGLVTVIVLKAITVLGMEWLHRRPPTRVFKFGKCFCIGLMGAGCAWNLLECILREVI